MRSLVCTTWPSPASSAPATRRNLASVPTRSTRTRRSWWTAAVAASGSVMSGLQAVALRDFEQAGLAGRQLEHGVSPLAAHHPPGSHLVADLEHDEVAVQEHDVDGEAHEPGVHCRGRPQQKAFAGRKPRAPEEAAH